MTSQLIKRHVLMEVRVVEDEKKPVCLTILIYVKRVEMTLLILKHYILKQYLIFALVTNF